MSGELGLYHAVSGYDETPEGVPEYEWLDCVGIVNQKGEMVTEAIYDQGLAINGDLIPVARDGLWGYVKDVYKRQGHAGGQSFASKRETAGAGHCVQ